MMGTIEAIKKHPDIARFQFRAKSRWISGGHCRTEIKGFYGGGQEDASRAHPFVLDGDEPAILLGEDHGADAVEAVLHTPASCLTVGFVYNASAWGISVESLEFILEGDLDLNGFLGLSETTRPGYEDVRVRCRIKADAPREKLEKPCAHVQKTSPVLDILRQPVPATFNLD
jgi:uncharacterized OsmC-like protein